MFEKKENRFNQYIDDKDFHYEEYAKREKKDSEVFRAHVIIIIILIFVCFCLF